MSNESIIASVITFVSTAWIFFFLGKAHQLRIEQKSKFKSDED